jgi:iron complex outermembrane receptor protein
VSKRLQALLAATCGALALSLPGWSTAQQLEEIVVTAQKREESLQEVPIAVTAFTGDDLASMKVATMLDVAAQTPGLIIKNQFATEGFIFAIRGVGTNDPSTVNSPTVSVYTDQVLLPYHYMLGFNLYDIERVEVLKGPQGTLYGRNNTGGAVNVVLRKPEHDPSAYARVDWSTFNTLDVEAAATGGFTETLAGRVSFQTTQRMKGFQRNRFFPGREATGEMERYAARGMLAWTPTEDLDVLVRVSAGSHDDEQWQYEHHATQDPAFAFGAPPAVLCGPALTGRRAEGPCVDFYGYLDPDEDQNTGDWNSAWEELMGPLESIFTSWGSGITVDWDLPRFTLTSVTGYERFSRNAIEDSDGSPVIALEAGFFDDIWTVTQELRLTSDESWEFMERPLDWILGFFYYIDNVHGQTVFLMRDLLGSDFDHKFDQDSEAFAGFANFGVQIAPQWKIHGGIRVTHETREMTQQVVDTDRFGISILDGKLFNFLCFFGIIPQPCPGPVFDGPRIAVDVVDREISVTDISGEAGVDWSPTDDLLLYAKFSKGFKSGGFNSLVVFLPGDAEPFKEEEVYAWEWGIKSTLLDGSLRFNAAGFYMEWKDLQAQIAQPGGDFPVSNAGDMDILGFDAEVRWAPLEGLETSFGVSYLDTEIVKSNPDLAFDLTGSRGGSAPEWTFNGLVRYTVPLPWWGLHLTAQSDFYWQDEMYFEVKNTPPIREKPYWLFNSRVSIGPSDERWELAVWGRNLTETVYASELFDFTGVNGTALRVAGFPREAGVSLTYRWD